MALLLGADIGTSSLKAVLFDEGLRALATSKQEYPTAYPSAGWAEQDPDDWVRAFVRACQQLLGTPGVRPGDIAAIGIDGMSSLALPVDGQGSPLRPAMIWLDRRATAEADAASARLGGRLIEIGANRSDPSSFAPKVAWMRDREPDVYRRAACFLHCNAYLVQRLTGAFSMDVSEAGMSLVCDIRTGQYSPELVEGWGLDRRKLPPVLRCSEIAGRVTRAMARETGLSEGTPVVAGAMDNVAATVGLGLRNAGDAYIAGGTVINVGILRDQPVFDGKGLVYHSGVDGHWLVNGGADYGGAGLLWFRNLLRDVDLAALGELGAGVGCGEHPLVFLPYMAGQRAPLWNDFTSGVVLGVTPGTERRHLARMFLESVALAARHVFDELCATRPARAALTGGITNNRAWSQLVADVTGIRLSLRGQAEVSTLGAAVLAGMGGGVFRNVDEAFARLPAGPECIPDRNHFEYYEALYSIFSKAYWNVLDDLKSLSELRRTGVGSGTGKTG
jgi:sugar (pentulose or hexulose) kinase